MTYGSYYIPRILNHAYAHVAVLSVQYLQSQHVQNEQVVIVVRQYLSLSGLFISIVCKIFHGIDSDDKDDDVTDDIWDCFVYKVDMGLREARQAPKLSKEMDDTCFFEPNQCQLLY